MTKRSNLATSPAPLTKPERWPIRAADAGLIGWSKGELYNAMIEDIDFPRPISSEGFCIDNWEWDANEVLAYMESKTNANKKPSSRRPSTVQRKAR